MDVLGAACEVLGQGSIARGAGESGAEGGRRMRK